MASTPAHWAWGVAGGAVFGRVMFGDAWYEIAAGAFLGTPAGSRTMASGTRAAYTGLVWASGTTPGLALRSTAWGAVRFSGLALAAVATPVAIGYAASYAIGENTGYSDATNDYLDFLSGGVSPSQYFDAVTLQSMR